MILLLYVFISLVLTSELFSSSFNTISDLDGWSILSSFPFTNPIGIGLNNVEYVGYGSLHGESLLEESLIKEFQDLPPHYAIEMRVKIYMYRSSNKPSGSAYIFIRLDGIQIQAIVIYFEQGKQDIEHSISIINTHYGNSLTIQYALNSEYDSQQTTIGIREFYLYVKKCPQDCLFCQVQQLDAPECTLWTLGHKSLFDINVNIFNNDGWGIMDKYNNNNDNNEQIKIYECSKDKVTQQSLFTMIGLNSYTQQFERVIILEPHYKIYLSYLQFLLNPLQYESVYWVGEINGEVKYDVRLRILTIQSRICDYSKTFQTFGDYLLRIQKEIIHQNTTLIFKTYTMQYTAQSKARWGIRDFEIYIKKCHTSCLYSCQGPKEQDCILQVYPQFNTIMTSFQDTIFNNLDGWFITTPTSFSSTLCNGQSIIGGYQVIQGQHILQKIFSFSKHNSLQISFKFYQIDSFSNDILYIVVDDIIIHQITLNTVVDLTIATPLCGQYSILDASFIVQTPKFDHKNLLTIIQIYTNQPISSTGYWGIREFYIKADGKIVFKEFIDFKFNEISTKSTWILTPKLETIIQCNTQSFIQVQGSNIQNSSLRKIIESLQNHKQLRIRFTLYISSVIISNEYTIIIKLDGVVIWTKKLNSNFVNYCGDSNLSTLYKFDEIFWHTNSRVFIEIITNQIANQYWGVRDFELQYNNRGLD